jgi:hypothetical protein
MNSCKYRLAVVATFLVVAATNLIAELGAASAGMMISQVVPSPTDPMLALSRDYQVALKISALPRRCLTSALKATSAGAC